MIATSEIKVGSAFMFEGNPFIVQKKLGQQGGRQGITVKLRVKNIATGGTQDLGIDAGEKFDEVDLEEKTVKLSYIDGDDFHFMDQETYEDVLLSKDDLGDNAGYISPDDDYDIFITYYEGKPVGVKLPVNVTRTITYCEPACASSRASSRSSRSSFRSRRGWTRRAGASSSSGAAPCSRRSSSASSRRSSSRSRTSARRWSSARRASS